MHAAPIYFQFSDTKAAFQAFDTLDELGYHVHFMDRPDAGNTLQVFVDRGDLTSALEIVQAHGGTVLESYDSPSEPSVFSGAYGMEDGVAVPAHVVTEDLGESYMSGGEGSAEETEEFEPSGEGYDHFPAGIRL